MIHFSVVSRFSQEAARGELDRTVAAKPNPNWRNKPMMSKTTRKLVLKKELLRTLEEGHLRAVNGGKFSFLCFAPARDEYYSLRDVCGILSDPTNAAPEAAPL